MRERKEGKRAELFGALAAVLLLAAGAWWAVLPDRSDSGPYELECARDAAGKDFMAVSDSGYGSPAECSNSQRFILGDKMDINTATAADLARIEGIGEKTAQAIVEARARKGGFEKLGELDSAPGITDRTMIALEKRVEVR